MQAKLCSLSDTPKRSKKWFLCGIPIYGEPSHTFPNKDDFAIKVAAKHQCRQRMLKKGDTVLYVLKKNITNIYYVPTTNVCTLNEYAFNPEKTPHLEFLFKDKLIRKSF